MIQGSHPHLCAGDRGEDPPGTCAKADGRGGGDVA